MAGKESTKAKKHRSRSILSAVLIVLGCVLAPLAVTAVWVNNEVGDTNRFVQTMEPLATNPDLQAAVTNRVTDVVVQQTNVNSLVTEAASGLSALTGSLPRVSDAIGSLAAPITDGVTTFVHTAVQKFVQSNAFPALWNQAMRTAHSSVDQLLTGSAGVVQANGSAVTVDLGPIVEQVKGQLVADGFKLASNIPEVHTSLTIAQTGSLGAARHWFRVLQIVGDWAPVLTVLILAAGVFAATRRRSALVKASFGVAIAMAVVAIALVVGRHFYINALPATVSVPAAGAVFDTVVRFLRVALRTIGVLALVVALGALLTGPAGFAAKVRALCAAVFGGARALTAKVGFDPGPVGGWVHRYRRWVAYGALTLAVVWFVLLQHPTVPVVLWLTFGVLAVLAVLEFLDPSSMAAAKVVAASPIDVAAAGGPAADPVPGSATDADAPSGVASKAPVDDATRVTD